ncbi:class E sortase [Terrabacter sp. BE26]|uniref:class E sortase n=1 Tax=Terrabacter sp. BE26 TaxID=2898152 RepID=UPI0035BE3EBC
MTFRILVRTVGELLFTAGVLVGLFVVWLLGWQAHVQSAEQAEAVSGLERTFDPPTRAAARASQADPVLPEPKPGEAFAVLRIPRLGADWAKPVREGVGADVLAEGMGRYPGTAMPGAIGNVGIAGHRSGHGNPLLDIDLIRPGDVLVIETKSAYNVYRAVRYEIVAPDRSDVVAPVPQRPGVKPTERWFTLTTCSPRWGNAARYIVFSRLETSIPRAQGLPASYLAAPKES